MADNSTEQAVVVEADVNQELAQAAREQAKAQRRGNPRQQAQRMLAARVKAKGGTPPAKGTKSTKPATAQAKVGRPKKEVVLKGTSLHLGKSKGGGLYLVVAKSFTKVREDIKDVPAAKRWASQVGATIVSGLPKEKATAAA